MYWTIKYTTPRGRIPYFESVSTNIRSLWGLPNKICVYLCNPWCYLFSESSTTTNIHFSLLINKYDIISYLLLKSKSYLFWSSIPKPGGLSSPVPSLTPKILFTFLFQCVLIILDVFKSLKVLGRIKYYIYICDFQFENDFIAWVKL